jgi:hypothetical protein
MTLISLEQRGKVSEREWHMIQSPTFILTIAWNLSGFHVVDMLPKVQKFEARYDVSAILEPLVASRHAQATGAKGRLIVHAENAKPTQQK